MTASPKTTAAEAELAAQFAALEPHFSDASAGAGFLPDLAERRAACAQIERDGLPTRRVESWHYTDMRRLLPQIPAFAAHEKQAAALPPLLAGSAVFPLVNGKAQPAQDAPAEALRAVALSQNAQAETAFSVLPAADKQDKGDIVNLVNSVFAQDGWHIDAAASDKMPVLELQNIQTGGQSHSRFPVHIGKNAKVTLIERQCGDNQASFQSFVSQLKLAEGAEAHWIILRDKGLHAAELNRFQALLGRNAKLKLYIVNAGGHFLRQEVNVDLAGEGANFQLRGINLLAGKSHSDTTMVVRHLVENTASAEIFRNVVLGEARGVFQGMIRVAQIAQKTDARMACNSLILSDKAEFSAKPELEIFADDVACGHGATVAEIDHDHLFYLTARGIPEAEARALLIKAFVNELIEELPENLAASLHEALGAWLKAHFNAA